MYAICGGDVELYSIEYFRGYGCWLQALIVARGVAWNYIAQSFSVGMGVGCRR